MQKTEIKTYIIPTTAEILKVEDEREFCWACRGVNCKEHLDLRVPMLSNKEINAYLKKMEKQYYKEMIGLSGKTILGISDDLEEKFSKVFGDRITNEIMTAELFTAMMSEDGSVALVYSYITDVLDFTPIHKQEYTNNLDWIIMKSQGGELLLTLDKDYYFRTLSLLELSRKVRYDLKFDHHYFVRVKNQHGLGEPIFCITDKKSYMILIAPMETGME